MTLPPFTPLQSQLLIFGSALFLASLSFHIRQKEKWSLAFLLGTALCLFSFSALLDPFLNLWDERFHALVAKNMMHHPFYPTLYEDPIVTMPQRDWTTYHLWLHKQPFFLWQIALSFKIFGISEFSLRIPNILMATTIVYATYRMGTLLTNRQIGFVAASMVICTTVILELVAGRQELEHNDLSFMAYISLSLWAFMEYRQDRTKKWIILIGLFSGIAILCKWVVGLLVYLGWFILNLAEKKWKLKDYADASLALAITLAIAAPWQIYIFLRFPEEALMAYQFNIKHFSTVLEGHEGTFFYHFNQFKRIYGSYSQIMIFPALYFLFRLSRDKAVYFAWLGMLLAVYIFFSLAATKMPAFPLVTIAIVQIAFAALFARFLDFLSSDQLLAGHSRKLIFTAVVLFVIIRFDIKSIRDNHCQGKGPDTYPEIMAGNVAFLKSLNFLPSNAILFKVNGKSYIDVMFYHGIPAHDFLPDSVEHSRLKALNRRIAVLKYPEEVLPAYLQRDPDLIVIPNRLKGFF